MIESAALPERAEALVVGAGLAGLACARQLVLAGVDVHVVDSSDAVGGRVRTDEVDGFLLDRGFQVMLTAYEEVQSQVDLARLDVRAFRPGSKVWNGQALQTMGDPFRDPGSAVASARARVGTFGDKLRVAALRRDLLAGTAEACFAGAERSTQEELEAHGFSASFIDTFFRPFLGGVFLERPLETSSSLFRYYFRCFAAGDAVVPARGMQRLPELLALPVAGHLTLSARVAEVHPNGVVLDDGTKVEADHVVVAVDGAAAAHLLGGPAPAFKAAVTSYYAAPQAPVHEPLLVLDGEGTGPVNHVAVMSQVAPDYAPPGMHLVAASGVDAATEDVDSFASRAPVQLRRWFGASVDRWEHLRTYRIPHALPRHPAGSLAARAGERRSDGLVVAGDYCEFGAIQGALLSGRRAADAVLSVR
jgi:phytoene dehydrogenase-like protein